MSTKKVNDDGLTFMEEFELLDREMTKPSKKKSAPKKRRHVSRTAKRKQKQGGVTLSPTEKGLITAGCVVAILAVALSGILVEARQIGNAVRSFQQVGTGMEGIAMIGEEGVVAVAQAKYDAQRKEELEKAKKEAEELEEKDIIKVDMTAQTIKGDLKIKFLDSETGHLIEGVPFAAKITDPSGSEKRHIDDDKNGIIYLEGIPAGTYTVEEDEIEGKKYKKYRVNKAKHAVAVSDVLAYEAVDVSDEVKDQSEVNAAAEDNMAANDTPEEATLVNTVELVESTKTLISGGDSYKEIPKSMIRDPYQTASVRQGTSFVRLSRRNENTEDGTQNTPAEKIALQVEIRNAPASLNVGESAQLAFACGPAEGVSELVWSTPGDYVVVSTDGRVTAVKGGGVSQITLTAKSADPERYIEASHTVSIEVKEVQAASGAVALTFPDGNREVQTGYEGQIKVTWTGDAGGVSWQVAPEGIISVNMDGSFKALKAGTATVTATSLKDSSATAVCNITVTEAPAQVNDNAELKDADGNQVYVKAGEEYRRAVNTDYRSEGPFYVMTHSTEVYRYTGFQTINGKTYYYDKTSNLVRGEQVIGGITYKFDDEGVLQQGSGGARGIDVSQYNGAIDWAQVKASGVEFAIIRLGYRGWGSGVLVEDSRFRQNIQGAAANGIRVGVYFVTQAVNDVEAVEEASMVLGIIRNYGISYPVFLDVETSGGKGAGRADGISVATRTAVCNAFCRTISNSGYRAGVYANKTWLDKYIDTPQIAGYNIWMAQYYTEPTYRRTKFDMWQYTSSGNVPGIAGRVDLNICYTAY